MFRMVRWARWARWVHFLLFPLQYLVLGWYYIIQGRFSWMILCLPLLAFVRSLFIGSLDGEKPYPEEWFVCSRYRFTWLYGRGLSKYAAAVLSSYFALMAVIGFQLVYPQFPTVVGPLEPHDVGAQIGLAPGSLHRLPLLLGWWLTGVVICRVAEQLGKRHALAASTEVVST
jgi:hypothetical protein